VHSASSSKRRVTGDTPDRRASSAGPRREMPRRTAKGARHARTGARLRPAQRRADDRRNRRVKTMVVQGRFVYHRSSCVAAAIARTMKRALLDEPAEPH
jgi:hypothetical protein